MRSPAEKPPTDRVPADTTKWSTKSQNSVAAGWTSEYIDIHYQCWRCKADVVFSAADQKYTYEDKKAPIDQQRVFCGPCWRESLHIDAQLKDRQSRWTQEKASLHTDKAFLSGWLALLESKGSFTPYRRDVARMNMLRKLISVIEQAS